MSDIIFWIKVCCPHCKSWNWTYYGRKYDDEAAISCYPEVLHCWNCEKRFWIDPEEAERENKYETREYARSQQWHPEDVEACLAENLDEMMDHVMYEKGKQRPD